MAWPAVVPGEGRTGMLQISKEGNLSQQGAPGAIQREVGWRRRDPGTCKGRARSIWHCLRHRVAVHSDWSQSLPALGTVRAVAVGMDGY